MIKAIIFDAEGVIVDTEDIWDEEQIIFLAKSSVLYERNKVKHLVSGKSLKESTKTLMNLYGIEDDLDKLTFERMDVFQSILIEKILFIDGFLEFFDKVTPFFKVCVATSLNRNILEIIDKKLNISSLFQGNIFSIDDIKTKSKPDPAIFHYAAKKLEVNESNCLVIEDSPNGIEAANRAGMKSIGLATTYSIDRIANANFRYKNFREIPVSKLKDL